MNKYADALSRIVLDTRYKEGAAYGKPRQGHLEGTVEAHIKELTENLNRLDGKITEGEKIKLLLLIHVHDIMKYKAARNSPISDPMSHASLAREFLRSYLYETIVTKEDADLLTMVQYHDVNHALDMKFKSTGHYDVKRLKSDVIDQINDMELYCIFTIIDGFTESKDTPRLRQFIETVNKYTSVPRALEMLQVFGL